MEKAILKAILRSTTGKQVGVLRRQGKLPAVLYGHNVAATPILLDLKEASRTLASLTASSLVNIDLEGKQHAVLVREKQRDFIKNVLLHVDFQVVSLTEKIKAKVGIELTGISSAVKDFNGVVVAGLDQIEVEALPQDLPERIVLDISKLNKIGDSIYVRDLVVSEKVQIHENMDDMIVIITAQHEEEEEVVEAEVGAEEPEVIEKGKKEEEGEEATKA